MTSYAPASPTMAQAVGNLNTLLVGSILLLHVAVLMLLPFLLASSPWWALAIIPVVLTSSAHWGLIHEGIHKLLHEDSAANERLGRLLGILMGASFPVLRFGHLMHHKLNRDWHSERVEKPSLRTKIYYYYNLFFGLYITEFLLSILLAVLPHQLFMRLARSTFLASYPEVAVAGERFFYQRHNVRAVREDVGMMALLYGTAFLLYGAHWPILLGFLVARAFVISFLDNVYHYATPGDNSKAGKELTLPRLLSLLLLHSNYHETHHLNPDVPWHALPDTHKAQSRAFDGPWMMHARMQLWGPVV